MPVPLCDATDFGTVLSHEWSSFTPCQISQMKSDLSVAVLGSESVCDALRASDREVSPVTSPAQLFEQKSAKPPGLIVCEADFVPDASAAEVVRLVRSSLPLTDVLVWAPRGSGRLVGDAFRAGARDVIIGTSLSGLVDAANRLLDDQQILPKVHQLAAQRMRSSRFESLLSRSDAMWDMFDRCARIAPADATVLIVGETGTGKELLARAIHRQSGRKGRFIACNCGSISEQLIESELFGHIKGAFTGATREKKGLVRHADQGTLFLDEIGDMPDNVQVNLLRLLQEKRIRPVGAHEEIAVDIRVVAATNVPLDEAVAEGRFREDLFYRLDVIRMTIPPLRERPEDIVFLFGHFVKKLKSHYGTEAPKFSDGFLDAMTMFDWPGNVRQLQNFAERTVLASTRKRLTANDVGRILQSEDETRQSVSSTRVDSLSAKVDAINLARTLADNLQPVIEDVESRYLFALLRANNGRIAESAAQAGISRRTLLRKLKAYSMDKTDFKE